MEAVVNSTTGFFHWITGASSGSTYELTRWIFLRSLGVVYGIAFISLFVQVKGLIGEQGILPAEEFLRTIRGLSGPERYRLLPTIFWFTGGGNTVLLAACAVGILAALLLIAGITPVINLIILFILYLSFFTVSRDFLSFQWDTLLLETGFLAIVFASTRTVSPVMLFLLWWFLFRFMFESGIVKLVSGDKTWRDLTALTYHYETQPITTWTAWYMHHLPFWFHKGSTIVMYVIELFFPFLIFFSRPLRIVSCVGMIGLQVLIGATGNYNFFNLLTIALCLLLLDDALWHAFLPGNVAAWLQHSPFVFSVDLLQRTLPVAIALLAGIYLLVSVFQLLQTVDYRVSVPRLVRRIERTVDPLRIINAYGLFRVMTTTRPEIVVEGSNDGETWLPYEFRWKPGDPTRRPGFVEPHQPRLDWQMWFAALGTYGRTPWFQRFLGRLLEGAPDVLGLLKHNPFPDAPPTRVRALLYEYEFMSPEERRTTGAWWKRRLLGPYSPVLSLQ